MIINKKRTTTTEIEQIVNSHHEELMLAITSFDELVKSKKEFKFYGVDHLEFKLDTTIWEALENPSDGYRSYLGSIQKKDSKGIFISLPLATVTINFEDDTDDPGYIFKDVEDNHIWLFIGTSYSDFYYPQFMFRYYPKINA